MNDRMQDLIDRVNAMTGEEYAAHVKTGWTGSAERLAEHLDEQQKEPQS